MNNSVNQQSKTILFENMRTAYRAQPMPKFETRRMWLDQLEKLITKYESQLIDAMQADFSYRSAEECMSLDLGTTHSQIRMINRSFKHWMRPQSVHVPLTFQPARAQLRPQPRGVVGIMAPWNFPVYLAIAPMAAALAAGNRVMLKPSELTPQTSQVLAEAIAHLFQPEEATVVLGGAQISAEFSALPFDHLLFTGSTAVGRKVASQLLETSHL